MVVVVLSIGHCAFLAVAVGFVVVVVVVVSIDHWVFCVEHL